MKVAIGLGSSLGDRVRALERAVRRLDATPGVRVLRVSRLYRTPPMRGGTARGWFLNAVALVEVSIPVEALLRRCRALEEEEGRRRARFWGDRTLDLDLLHAEGTVRAGEELTLPHPGIRTRPFVWLPLREVWPDAVDPATRSRFADAPPPPGPRPSPVGLLARRMRAP